jgi:signal transduction histidine kinase
MDIKSSSRVNVGVGANLAFAVVVMTAYFMMFSNIQQASTEKIVVLILLGTAYIFNGIYGFSYCLSTSSNQYKTIYFFSQLIIGGCITFLGGNTKIDPLIYLPLTAHSVILLTSNGMYAFNLVIFVIFLISSRFHNVNWSDLFVGLPYLLAGQIFIMVFTQMAVSETRARIKVEGLVHDLEEANDRLRKYAFQVEELTLIKERNRLAREIHDGLGHYLTTIYMQLQAARAVIQKDPDKVDQILTSAQSLTQDALNDVRSSVTALRDSPDHPIPIQQKLKTIVENISETDVKIEFRIQGNPRKLSSNAELALFRVAQEGINNSIRHGKADYIEMALDFINPEKVFLSIRDNGIGADNIQPGFGLTGLNERLTLLKGSLSIKSISNNGCLLEIWVPG